MNDSNENNDNNAENENFDSAEPVIEIKDETERMNNLIININWYFIK